MSKVTSIKTFDDLVDDEEIERPDTTGPALLELASAIKELASRPEPVFPKTDLSPIIKLAETLAVTPKKKKWEFDVQRNTITGDIQKIIATEK